MKKYYLIAFAGQYVGSSTWLYENKVIAISPLEFLAQSKPDSPCSTKLLWAMEITEEEYLKYHNNL